MPSTRQYGLVDAMYTADLVSVCVGSSLVVATRASSAGERVWSIGNEGDVRHAERGPDRDDCTPVCSTPLVLPPSVVGELAV